jgi:hypothetical protein
MSLRTKVAQNLRNIHHLSFCPFGVVRELSRFNYGYSFTLSASVLSLIVSRGLWRFLHSRPSYYSGTGKQLSQYTLTQGCTSGRKAAGIDAHISPMS